MTMSSEDSFNTATDSVDASGPPSSLSHHCPPQTPKYRPAKQLPREIRAQTQIYFEEKLYTLGISVLTNCLTTNPSSTTPLYTPTPTHLSYLSTLLIHPHFTSPTRAPTATSAFSLLRSTLSLLGPLNANFSTAFTYTPHRRSGARYRDRGRTASSEEASGDEDEVIESKYVGEESVFRLAESFWDCVGWALNCSVTFPSRWEYWSPWLEFMVDVLSADWHERQRLDTLNETSTLSSSLLIRYMQLSGLTNTYRRIVKSIFANGDDASLASFPEIFDDEAGRKRRDLKRKREVEQTLRLDLEEEDEEAAMGAYSQHSDSDPTPTPPLSPTHTTTTPSTTALDALGGSKAYTFRLRLLSLLSLASYTHPALTLPLPTLYDLLYDQIRPLPLAQYTLYLHAHTTTHLPPAMLISLLQLHLSRLLPTSAPLSSQEDDSLSQRTLETCYLPFAAQKRDAGDCARYAVGVEMLVRCFVGAGGEFEDLEGFGKVVREGVALRLRGVKEKGRVRGGGREDVRGLRESGERLVAFVDFLVESGQGGR